MKFIGRKEELGKLEAEYQRDGSFVVVYGRRRVGKTTLIKEFIKNKTAFYYLATEELEVQSMKRLAGVIGRATNNSLLNKAVFNDWLDLFQLVADYKPNEKKVLVIDEFPYLVKTNPAFPSILQNAWDELLKDNNVMLILSGSLIGMMLKHTLSYDSPLYGRRTAQMRLSSLPFNDVYMASGLTFERAVEQYAITGGVPKYLEFFEDGRELVDQIKDVVLNKSGFLYEEPFFLLRSESLSAVNYFSIIKTIADGNHKLGKIASALNQDTSSITPYLSTLTELGFIEKRIPVTEKNPEKTRKGLYFISDNFIRFWFHYVYPYKGELELDNVQIVLDEINKDFKEKFVAFAYEDICKEIFQNLCKKGSIDFVPSRIGSYWLNDFNNDTEIDVMAIDNQNKRIFVGECKYHNKSVDAQVYFSLKEKVENNDEIKKGFTGFELIYGLFSKSGFTNRMLDIAKENVDILLINDDTLLK
ncbi:MAG: ATP-binding protein [Solobacterium sp.]|nr:ATP-binding protein [Solobacterium sp.]MDY2953239.1 ATP-binding protein [Erysipelotrichaceae bacterium]MCI7446393.1 ATP-binding protein [Solobacterium sp.]MDD5801924.1 ATP-binding protein [Solobacterium sp.]MDD7776515.1 ATP-binding protein [Solobacterium sp.]